MTQKHLSTFVGAGIIFAAVAVSGLATWFVSSRLDAQQEVLVSEREEEAAAVAELQEEQKELPTDYEIREDGVYYQGELMEGADPKTFELEQGYIDNGVCAEDPLQTFEAKDENHKYIFGRRIMDIQRDDLIKVAGNGGTGTYYRDANYVYKVEYISCAPDRAHNWGDGPLVVMNEFDAVSFEETGVCRAIEGTGGFPPDYYFRDESGVYCGDDLIEGADPETFEFIGYVHVQGFGDIGFARDEGSVFQENILLENSDPETFELPNEAEVRDRI